MAQRHWLEAVVIVGTVVVMIISGIKVLVVVIKWRGGIAVGQGEG